MIETEIYVIGDENKKKIENGKAPIENIEEIKLTDKRSAKSALKSKVENLKHIFLEFSQRTNVDCYSKIFDYENVFIKLIWIIILVTSLTFTSYLLMSNINNYFGYDVTTKIGSYYQMPTEFPAVTFCDANAFTSYDAQDLFWQHFNGWDWGSAYNTLYMAASDPSYGDENRKKLGLKISQISCTYNNTDCQNDLHWYWSYDYGNCFQFNTGLNLSDDAIEKKQVNVEGPMHGLQIRIYPFKHYNFYARIKDFGIVVFVHNSSLKPTSTNLVFLEPGMSSFIQVKRTYVNNYPAPYTSCIDLSSYSSPLHDYITKSLNRTYRQRDCFELCIQQLIINSCNCSYSGFNNPNINSTVEPCLALNDFNCYTNMFYQFDPLACASSSCPLECQSVEYDLYVSSLTYPSTALYYGECNPYHWIPECISNPHMSYDDYRTLYVKFDVYYSTLAYSEVSVVPAMTIFDLIGNIGGSMSLIVSISFFTLFEIIELLILMMHAVFCKKTNRIFL